MMKKAKEDGMMAVALTDHGNMFGCFDFVKEAEKNKIKPILGCEFYMVKDRHKQSFVKSAGEKDEISPTFACKKSGRIRKPIQAL